MQSGLRPHRPVVPSSLRAEHEASVWTSLHDYRTLKDGAGLIWRTEGESHQKPDPDDRNALIWGIKISLSCKALPEQLVATGTLDPDHDERLLVLLNQEAIPMQMRPHEIWGANQTVIDTELRAYLPKLKQQILQNDLHAVKRQLVHHWIETITSFAHPR